MKYLHYHSFRTFLFIANIFLFSCDQTFFFSGDAVTVKRNFVFYPRFRAEFAYIPAHKSIERIYSFKGIPSREYTFKFELQLSDGRRKIKWKEINSVIWEKLSKAGIEVSFELFSNGEKIKSIGPKPLLKSWTFAAIGDIKYFWNKELVDLLLHRKDKYQIKISLKSNSETPTNLAIVPIIEGGGIVLDL